MPTPAPPAGTAAEAPFLSASTASAGNCPSLLASADEADEPGLPEAETAEPGLDVAGGTEGGTNPFFVASARIFASSLFFLVSSLRIFGLATRGSPFVSLTTWKVHVSPMSTSEAKNVLPFMKTPSLPQGFSQSVHCTKPKPSSSKYRDMTPTKESVLLAFFLAAFSSSSTSFSKASMDARSQGTVSSSSCLDAAAAVGSCCMPVAPAPAISPMAPIPAMAPIPTTPCNGMIIIGICAICCMACICSCCI
mmetsp:Transcript_14247/g.39291  ORF Transcript_14247/g.39291 Transcript_14247/m.39291 type:complete len:250 (+) Transcript_14247:238-987(+)